MNTYILYKILIIVLIPYIKCNKLFIYILFILSYIIFYLLLEIF